MLRGENAVAKTLQSAVETLERDKAQLQGRVHSLEQRLMGTQASENAAGAPPSGEEAAFRSLQYSVIFVINLFCFPCLPSGGTVLEQLREEKEFAEGQVRARALARHASSGGGGLSLLTRVLSRLPQINFLNSVIVDLQRKNEELKIKLKKLALAEFNGNDNGDGWGTSWPLLIPSYRERLKKRKNPIYEPAVLNTEHAFFPVLSASLSRRRRRRVCSATSATALTSTTLKTARPRPRAPTLCPTPRTTATRQTSGPTVTSARLSATPPSPATMIRLSRNSHVPFFFPAWHRFVHIVFLYDIYAYQCSLILFHRSSKYAAFVQYPRLELCCTYSFTFKF